MCAAGELRLRGMFGTGFVTFHWQDDGSIDEEILETIRMAVLDLDEVKNILDMKIKEYNQQSKSFAGMKILCNNFNKIIETLVSLWKGTHRLRELHQLPSLNFLEHVMRRCYKNCARNSSSALQVFDKKTFQIIDALFKHFQLTEDDVLTEINSGCGSAVLQLSASSSCKCCYGIASKTDPASESENMAAEFIKWMEFYGKDFTEFRLYHEDLTSNDMLKLISDSTVIFLKDHNVGSEMESKISFVFSQLNEGNRIISLENCSQLFAFKDRTVDVKECTTGQSDVKYFLHEIKTRTAEDVAKMESQSLSSASSAADVEKKRQLPDVPSPSISTSSTQQEFKVPGITNDAVKVSPSSEVSSALAASLDNILSSYRNQFIKFIEYMQTKEYRLQLGEAVKEEQRHKTEMKKKIESLLQQINELNGSSLSTLHHDHGTNSNGDVLAEVRTLVTYNRQLKILETLLKNEICQLERRETVQDDLQGLNHTGLLKKAGDCYEKYIELKEKVRSLEVEVATLEGKKENSANVSDRQGSTSASTENAAFKSVPPTQDVDRKFPVAFVADAFGAWPRNNSSPQKSSQSDQHFSVVPFNKSKTSPLGLSFQCPKDVDSKVSYPPALRPHGPSTSGDSATVLHGSNGRVEGFNSSVNNDQCSSFAGIGSTALSGLSALSNRRGSSSSTDTAESGQGPRYSAQNLEGNSISSWPNSPDPLQAAVSRFPSHSSRIQQVLSSATEHCMPSIQATFSVAQRLAEERMNLSQTLPQVVAGTGRGKPAAGKRGRRKRAAPDADDAKGKPPSFPGKRGKLAPLSKTGTDAGWKLFADNEMRRQDALIEGHDLGFHQGIQQKDEHGYAKHLTSNGSRTTKTDVQKAQDAGNLDALLMAVSLHHLQPSHRNMRQDNLLPQTTKIPPQMLMEPLMQMAKQLSSASLLPALHSSSSIISASGKSPLTTLSWSLPQVMTMQSMLSSKEIPVLLPTYDENPMETEDDSHGKHFKKRYHSTNLKNNRAKKIGSTADSPNPSSSSISETTTTTTATTATTNPILKSLFSKRNDNTNLTPTVQGGDQLEVDRHHATTMHPPTDAQLTTSRSSQSMQRSSEGHSSQTTGATAVNQTSNVVIPPTSEMSRYMNVSCQSSDPLNKQLEGLKSWFSLPLSLLRQMQMPQSDTLSSSASSAAERQLSTSDELLSAVFTSVSNQRTVTSSSLATNVAASSSGKVERRGNQHKAVTK